MTATLRTISRNYSTSLRMIESLTCSGVDEHHRMLIINSHHLHLAIRLLHNSATSHNYQLFYHIQCNKNKFKNLSSNPVLIFSRPRSEGRPHHGHTFSIYLCPLSFWLLHKECCPGIDIVHPGYVWSSLPACTWHCSLYYLFLQATPLFSHGVTIVC